MMQERSLISFALYGLYIAKTRITKNNRPQKLRHAQNI